jgi:hypothetical protein
VVQEKNAGFSTAPADELYLPIDSAESRPTVASELSAMDLPSRSKWYAYSRGERSGIYAELYQRAIETPARASSAGKCGRFSALYAEANKYPWK